MDLIDVIQVQTLVPRKRSRSADGPEHRRSPSADGWLTEVHKKIWKKKGLESELFRKVVVTQKDYDELQKRLKELHPDRGELDYKGSKPGSGVPRVKVDILRSLEPVKASSLLHPDDNDNRVQDGGDSELSNKRDDSEASNDDDDSEARSEDEIVLESLFPSTLEFLDLSTLGVDVTRLPFPLLLRQESQSG